MDGHQVDRVEGVDGRVRLVAHRQRDRDAPQCVRGSRTRGSEAGVGAPGTSSGSRAPAGAADRASRMHRPTRLSIRSISSAAGIRSTRPRHRAVDARASAKRGSVESIERAAQQVEDPRRSSASASRGARRRRASSESPNTLDRIRAAARRSDAASARYQNQRQHILDLVGIKESKALVDVRRNVVPCERRLELPMALPRSEEDGDVAGPYGAGKPVSRSRTVAPVSSRRAISRRGDLGALLGVGAEHHAERAILGGLCRRIRSGNGPISSYSKRVGRRCAFSMSPQTSLTNASSGGTARKLREIERRTSRSGRSVSIWRRPHAAPTRPRREIRRSTAFGRRR